jgi:hypothetical protein
MIADLNSMVAAFRGLRLAGEPQTFARLLIYDANDPSFVHDTREEHGVAGLGPKDGTANPPIDGIESLKRDDFKAATDQLGLSFQMD